MSKPLLGASNWEKLRAVSILTRILIDSICFIALLKSVVGTTLFKKVLSVCFCYSIA